MEVLFSKLVVVGVGLLGGSVALAAKKRGLVAEVLGLFRSHEKAREACQSGLVDRAIFSIDEALSLLQESPSCQGILFLLATPVETIPHFFDQLVQALEQCDDSRENILVTDVGSTKSRIMAAIADREIPVSVSFIGSHPIAGSEKSGAQNAMADLFEGRTTVLLPEMRKRENNERHEENFQKLQQFWTGLGSRTVVMTPEEHDQILAITSHLPHLLSGTLAMTASDSCSPFIGPGFLGQCRLAAGSPEIWTDIFDSNRLSLLEAIDAFEKTLHRWRLVLQNGEREQIFTLLEEAKKKRDALGS